MTENFEAEFRAQAIILVAACSIHEDVLNQRWPTYLVPCKDLDPKPEQCLCLNRGITEMTGTKCGGLSYERLGRDPCCLAAQGHGCSPKI